MSACPRQRPQTLASNDNGILTFRQDTAAPLSNIVRMAIEAAGSISLTYIADGVLAITRGQPVGRATTVRCAKRSRFISLAQNTSW
jgi:hypothetical protein